MLRSELQLQSAEQTLTQTIERAWADARAAEETLQARQTALEGGNGQAATPRRAADMAEVDFRSLGLSAATLAAMDVHSSGDAPSSSAAAFHTWLALSAFRTCTRANASHMFLNVSVRAVSRRLNSSACRSLMFSYSALTPTEALRNASSSYLKCAALLVFATSSSSFESFALLA